MLNRGSIGAITFAAALMTALAGAQAFDDSRYPDLKGQWRRFEVGPVKYDPSKPRLQQGAPLTPEYQAIFEANLKDQDAGGQGIDPTYTCLAPGMPRQMNAYEPMEIVITQDTTHILMEHIHDNRRIFTDGRNLPADVEPSFAGYSIGKWVDTLSQGRFDTLMVETRALKGPRVFDSSGIPFHKDGETVINERIYREATDPNLLFDEITVSDHALTRPWTVTKKYRRNEVARLARDRLRRAQPACGDRQGRLHAERGRHPDAHPEGSAAAGPAIFQANAEVTSREVSARVGPGSRQGLQKIHAEPSIVTP